MKSEWHQMMPACYSSANLHSGAEEIDSLADVGLGVGATFALHGQESMEAVGGKGIQIGIVSRTQSITITLSTSTSSTRYMVLLYLNKSFLCINY